MELLYNIEWSELLATWQSVIKMIERRNEADNEAVSSYKNNEQKQVISKWKKPKKVSDKAKLMRERIERGEL